MKCGAVYPNYAGRRSVLAKPDLKMVVDSVFHEINEPSVDLRAFLIIVDRAAFKVLKTRISSIKAEDLRSWGYEIQGSRLYRRKR